MDQVATLIERVKKYAIDTKYECSLTVHVYFYCSAFNWTEAWLSWLMVVVLVIITCVFYFVPLRLLLILWGVNKFTKKLRKPNAIANNELLDYLSRVPSDRDLVSLNCTNRNCSVQLALNNQDITF